MTTVTELAEQVNMRNQKNALEVLKEVEEAVIDSDNVGEIIVMLKLDGAYVRYSTKMQDTLGLVAFLELMKHDVLRRMSS